MATEVPLTYQQNPRPMGFGVTYGLAGDRLVVDTLRRRDEINLGAVSRLRLTYEAGKLSSGFYKTAIRLKDGRSVSLTSLSWSGLAQSTNQIEAYRAFVATLIAAVVHANPQARLDAGKPRFLWAAMALTTGALTLAAAYIALRAFLGGATGAALVPLALGAVMLWQMGPVVWRNRPRTFTADALPANLLGGLSPGASGSIPPGHRAPAGP
jgi:hypothetical protein